MHVKQPIDFRASTKLPVLVEDKKVGETSCHRVLDHLLHVICPAGMIISIGYYREDIFQEAKHFSGRLSARGDHDFWGGDLAEVLGKLIVCEFLNNFLVHILDVCLVSDSLIFYRLWYLTGSRGKFWRQGIACLYPSSIASDPFLPPIMLPKFPGET